MMQDKKSQKKPQKEKQEEEIKIKTMLIVDDFFTQFLEKRQKNFVKKLEKIEELKKKKEEELTTEQKDLIANVHLTNEKIKYFDDIKELYFQAYQKKENIAQEVNCPISDLMDIFFTGNVMQHLPISSLDSIESSLSKNHQNLVHSLYSSVFKASHTHDTLGNAKKLMIDALKDLELIQSVRNTINNKVLSNPNTIQINNAPIQNEIHLVKTERKNSSHKKQSIHEDEKLVSKNNNDEEIKQENIQTVNEENNIKIVQLPVEGQEKQYRGKGRAYRGHNKRHNDNKNYNNFKNEERDYKDKPEESGQYRGRNNYKNSNQASYNKGNELNSDNNRPYQRNKRGYNEGEYKRKEDAATRPQTEHYVKSGY